MSSAFKAPQISDLEIAANRGDIESIKTLAAYYFKGENGVKQDYKLARKWFLKAADVSPDDAQVHYILGELFYKGRGGKESNQAALYHLRKAARAGHVKAMHSLIFALHWADKEKPAPYNRAIVWIKRAAMCGNPSAMCMYADAYLLGCGCRKDPHRGFAWFRKAIRAGEAEAMFRLGIALKDADNCRRNQKDAERLLRMASKKGLSKAIYALGDLYLEMDPPQPFRAYYAFRHALKLGHGRAAYRLGKASLKGEFCRYNPERAVQYFLLGAKRGNSLAQYQLGMCCLNGEGCAKQPDIAAKWFFAAALGNSLPAQLQLGLCYLTGIGTPRSHEEAMKWFRLCYFEHEEEDYKFTEEQCHAMGEAAYWIAKELMRSPTPEKEAEALKLYHYAATTFHYDATIAFAELVLCSDRYNDHLLEASILLTTWPPFNQNPHVAHLSTRLDLKIEKCFLNDEEDSYGIS